MENSKFEWPATIESPECQCSFDENTISPLDNFHSFFSDDIVDVIADNTNLYSVKCGAIRSINVDKENIKDFLAVTVLMGVVQMPAYRDYWSKASRYPQIDDDDPKKTQKSKRRYLCLKICVQILQKWLHQCTLKCNLRQRMLDKRNCFYNYHICV